MRRISPRELDERLDGLDEVMILDARSDAAFAEASQTIPGAVRVSQADREADLEKLPRGQEYVLFCT